MPKILNFVKIIHYFSKLFTSLLNPAARVRLHFGLRAAVGVRAEVEPLMHLAWLLVLGRVHSDVLQSAQEAAAEEFVVQPVAGPRVWLLLLHHIEIVRVNVGELPVLVDHLLVGPRIIEVAGGLRVRHHSALRPLLALGGGGGKATPPAPVVLLHHVDLEADTIALEVDDSLGIAGGTFIATTDAEGRATVEAVDAPPAGVPLLRLGVRELSSLFLGGVSVSTLARAGRVEADDPTRIARVFQTVESPRLSFWY